MITVLEISLCQRSCLSTRPTSSNIRHNIIINWKAQGDIHIQNASFSMWSIHDTSRLEGLSLLWLCMNKHIRDRQIWLSYCPVQVETQKMAGGQVKSHLDFSYITSADLIWQSPLWAGQPLSETWSDTCFGNYRYFGTSAVYRVSSKINRTYVCKIYFLCLVL